MLLDGLAGAPAEVLGPPGANTSACLGALPRHGVLISGQGFDIDACAAGVGDSALWEIRFFPPTYALWPSPPLPRYLDQPPLDPEAAKQAVALLRARIREHWAYEPLAIPMWLCAPRACDAALVLEVLLPRHLELEFLGVPPPLPAAPLAEGSPLPWPVSRLPPAGCCSSAVSWASGGSKVAVPPLARLRRGDWPLWKEGSGGDGGGDSGGFSADVALCSSLISSVAAQIPVLPFGAALQALLLRGGDATIPLEDPAPAQAVAARHWEACRLLGLHWRPAVAIVLRQTWSGPWHEEQFMVCSPCQPLNLAELLHRAIVPPSVRAQGSVDIQVLVQPVVPWSLALPTASPGDPGPRPVLDFAIIGFAKSGTTTLATNLNTHPNVTVANCGPPCPAPGFPVEAGRRSECTTCEFRFWSLQHVNDFYAPAAAVIDLRSRFHPEKARAGALRGVKDSVAIRYARLLPRLAQVPGLRLVVTIRDPVDSFESRYNWYGCRRYGRDPVQMAQRGLHSCSLHRHPDAPYATEAGQLRALLATVPRARVFVLHAEALRLTPAATYARLLSFLGLPDFPPGHQLLPDANVRRSLHESGGGVDDGAAAQEAAPDLDLCAPRERDTLLALKEVFAAEYDLMLEHLEASGVPVPPTFRQRLTRCERRRSGGGGSSEEGPGRLARATA